MLGTTNWKRSGGWAKAQAILALGVLLGGTILWSVGDAWKRIVGPEPNITLFGSLPARDVAAIRRIVQHDVSRRVVSRPPHLTWPHIRWWLGRIPQLPKAIRGRERIDWIQVNSDGSVRVQTRAPMLIRIGSKVEDLGFGGADYTLK